MAIAYTETDSASIYYFDYAAHSPTLSLQSDLDELLGSTPALGGRRYRVRSTAAASIAGYRVAFTAVGRESPRLGLPNVIPRLEARPYVLDGAASPVQSAMQAAEEHEGRLAAVNPEALVHGVLYELPAECEAAFLELVGREGSLNRYAALPATITGGAGGVGTVVTALVCAALDLELLSSRYIVSDAFTAAWAPMPPLVAHAAAAAADPRRCGTGRWPYMHWCNCVASDRLAPSPEYLRRLHDRLSQSPGGGGGLPAGIATVAALLARFYGLAPLTAGGTNKNDGSDSDPHTLLAAIPTRNVAANPCEKLTWYLAYGSNLSWEQVCLRIGPPRDRRPVKLPGWELVANKTPYSSQYASFGYYNVEPCADRRRKEAAIAAAGEEAGGTVKKTTTMPPYVCGAAYEISQAQLEMMDGYETGYRRECHACEDLSPDAAAAARCGDGDKDNSGGELCAWIYIAEDTNEHVLPSKEYLERVLEGADILPAEYIAGIHATPTNPLRSPRQDRRLRKEL